MIRPLFQNILLLTPEIATGGPEALHQLGCEINRLSGSAWMAYCGPQSRVAIEPPIMRCDASASSMPGHFAQYEPRILREARLTPETLVVYPEVMTQAASSASAVNYRRAIWWLSVDNALINNPRLMEDTYRQNFFSDASLLHFHQSAYAEAFLRKSGLPHSLPLSDYTDLQFIERSSAVALNPPITQRQNRLCFFPNKGAALALQFIVMRQLRNTVDIVPIRKMTKAQVCDALFDTRVYIDFGHHPGKDRVPREAAVSGCVVLLHAQGAALHHADHPLMPDYLFTAADVTSGELHRRIDAILDDPQTHFAAQAGYREAVLGERERFADEVRTAFFAEDGA